MLPLQRPARSAGLVSVRFPSCVFKVPTEVTVASVVKTVEKPEPVTVVGTETVMVSASAVGIGIHDGQGITQPGPSLGAAVTDGDGVGNAVGSAISATMM